MGGFFDYCENLSAATFLLGVVGGAAALLPLWRRGVVSNTTALCAVGAWVAFQRFVSAGCRFPGRARLSELESKGTGKTFVVTGANTGIGFWTAVGLVESGAKAVIITCRDQSKCDATLVAIAKAIRGPNAGKPLPVLAVPMELGSLQSVKSAAQTIAKLLPGGIDCLINNAGAAIMPPSVTEDAITVDGLEATLGTNFVAPYLFTEELLPSLKQRRGRVVMVASRGHVRVTGDTTKALLRVHPAFHKVPGSSSPRLLGYRSYCVSKLGNVIHARVLARDLCGEVEAVSLHPGRVLTDVWRPVPILVDPGLGGRCVRALLSLHLRTAAEGANTTLLCALSPTIMNGAYYSDSHMVTPSEAAFDKELELLFVNLATAAIGRLPASAR